MYFSESHGTNPVYLILVFAFSPFLPPFSPLSLTSNFNHERWFIICYMLASNRATIEECFKWCMQRDVRELFGTIRTKCTRGTNRGACSINIEVHGVSVGET